MKFTKKKGDESTIRKVYNDDKSTCYGLVGKISINSSTSDHYGKTRDEALEELEKAVCV